MAGQTDNTNILAGANQLIQAVNDLVTAVTGQVITCSPDVNISNSCTPVINVSCGSNSGTEIPSDPGTEGDTPPAGWDDPTGEYDERKCKIANMIFDQYYEWMSLWEQYDVDTYVGNTIPILSSLLVALTGGLELIVSILPGIKYISDLVFEIVTGSFDLADLLGVMDQNKEELICALYNSTDAESAKDDFIQICLDNGASSGEIALLEAAIAIDALNYLYFSKITGEYGPSVEAALDGYVTTVECGGCGDDCPEYAVFSGLINEESGGMDAALLGGIYQAWVFFNHDGVNFGSSIGFCGDPVTISVTCVSNCPVENYGGVAYRCYNQSGTQIYGSNTPPTNVSNVGSIRVVFENPAFHSEFFQINIQKV